MTFPFPRITISAPHRSSGKSTVATGLCAAFSARGLRVQPFKKGPDFIDPMWHEAASGRQSRNLDIFMMGAETALESFKRNAGGADISVVEGNMGLFDGADPEGSDSTAGLARLIKSPVVLVIDCTGMTRGIAPLVKGFEDFEPGTDLRGVILNKVKGARHERKLRDAIEKYCGAEVLGALPADERVGVQMRHLGLVPLREDPALVSTIDAMRRVMQENVNLDRVLDLSKSAPGLEYEAKESPGPAGPGFRVGVAMDRAFTFYYPDNLDALRRAGAEIVPFSPIDDPALPDVDALYIGGGFPEVHMEALEKNAPMREAVRRAAEEGMPIYAECGGLMYLARGISWGERSARMCGVFDCEVKMSERPSGHGYLVLRPAGTGPWPSFGEEIRAHEFHHSSIEPPAGTPFAYEVLRGKGVDGRHDGLVRKNVLASYAHIHALATPGWAEGFGRFIRSLPA
ncbi:MAG TPA: cobyrinate a,c-diamide synthase [Nitrospirota bacterium]|nr:cobyrinate a,c-diamide synthase [Nitrospirota bacterium]